jgi:hypothetical protein
MNNLAIDVRFAKFLRETGCKQTRVLTDRGFLTIGLVTV